MKCARTACYSERAMHRHRVNGKLYCARCAFKINDAAGEDIVFIRREEPYEQAKNIRYDSRHP